NKNILDKLIVAFEKDPEATHALLNSKLFNSRGEILKMLSDKRFDGNKVWKMSSSIHLLSMLKRISSTNHRENKIDCILGINSVIDQIMAYSESTSTDQ
ncbi:hypothetical protein HET73_04900, partial [Wolbachia endosymbiont of Atemnus politus]|uniref:hypothetical protein n=1 Tax=Wolbachia endosymbiont of Atemnus politus TaxID=2682840 RepID=UPI001571795C